MAALCLFWLLLVAVYDCRQRLVPNWLVLAGAFMALAALASGTQPFGTGWAHALLGMVAGLALLLFYATGLMGAGDVKFASALGLWVGIWALLPIWLIASLIAGVHSVLLLLLKRWPISVRLTLLLSSQSTSADGNTSTVRTRFIPYAAYLSLATVAWMVWGRQSF
jgi:prepilin peptidase CpaA